MSHIDSYSHELVGLFGCLPVYRPLEDIPAPPEGQSQYDFGCTTEQLVIGGGSGEHSGLILRNAEGAVANFVFESGDFELTKNLKSYLSEMIDVDTQLHFAGWSTADHHGFYQLCISESLPNSFDPEGETGLEEWLHLGFGEFVYYAMPQLAQRLVDKVKPHHLDANHIRYNNITIVPPGMPVYANGGNSFFKS